MNDWLSPLFPAGFYYKTFMWPKGAWKARYEPVIRRAAGLGEAPTRPDPDRYAQRYAHCDVLVVGGGPAGLAAAAAAADRGARVILCDEQSELGGSLLGDVHSSIEGLSAVDWVLRTVAALSANPRVTLLARTTAFGYFPHNFVGLNERITDHVARPDPGLARERLWQVRAGAVVLATGSIERPLVFPGNDRPGIMLAGAAGTYLNRYGVRAGQRAVLVTSGDAAYRTALDLHAAGTDIAAIADLRALPQGELPEAARRAGIPVLPAATVLATGGDLRVAWVLLGRVAAGVPITAAENLEEMFVLPASFARRSGAFMLRVKGDSMIDAAILDGDLIVVEPKPDATNGEIVVAMIDGEATVKRFYREAGRVRLQPENRDMAPIYADDVTVVGRVEAVVRRL